MVNFPTTVVHVHIAKIHAAITTFLCNIAVVHYPSLFQIYPLSHQNGLKSRNIDLLTQHNGPLSYHNDPLFLCSDILYNHGSQLSQNKDLLSQHMSPLSKSQWFADLSKCFTVQSQWSTVSSHNHHDPSLPYPLS